MKLFIIILVTSFIIVSCTSSSKTIKPIPFIGSALFPKVSLPSPEVRVFNATMTPLGANKVTTLELSHDALLLLENVHLIRNIIYNIENKKEASSTFARITGDQWNYFKSLFVKVHITDNLGKVRKGSGILISENGWLITAAHLFYKMELNWKESYIIYNGDKFNLGSFNTSWNYDLAIVKAGISGQPVATNIQYSTPVVGGTAFLLSELANNTSISTGAIMLDEMIADIKDTYTVSDSFEASIYAEPGFSGSPVFNSNGEVIGICSYASENINNNKYVTGISLNEDVSIQTYKAGLSKVIHIKSLLEVTYKDYIDNYFNKNQSLFFLGTELNY